MWSQVVPTLPLLTKSITDRDPDASKHPLLFVQLFPESGDESNSSMCECVCVFHSSDVGLDVGVRVSERGGEGRRAGVGFSGRVWLLREQLLIGSFPLLELCRRQLGIGQQPVNQR